MGFFRNNQSTTTFLPLSPSSATIDDDREKREKSFAIRLKTRTMSRLQSKLEKNNTRFSKANQTKPKKSNGTESTFPQQQPQNKSSNQATKDDVSLSPASTWSLMSFPSPVSASSSFGSNSNSKEKANTSEYFESPTTPTPLLSLPSLKNIQSPPRTSSSIKQEEGVENNLPSDYIETITDVYGRPVSPVSSLSSSTTSSSSHALTVDLYNDVFHIPSDASEEQILEAYLQEGRKVLTEAKILFTLPPSSSSSIVSSSNNAAESNGIANTTQIVDYRNNNTIGANIKSKFVATSMAYEILTTPSMAQTYRRQAGLLTPTTTTTTMNPPNGNPGPSGSISVLRKSSFRSPSSPLLSPSTESSLDMLRSSSSCSTASIRWKDHVEIKTFTGHPDEHDPSRRRSSVKNGTNRPSKSGDTTTNSMQSPLNLPSRRRQGRNHQKNKNATTRASGTHATSIATNDTATGTEISIPSCDPPTPNVSTELGSRLFKMDTENDEQFQKDAWDVLEDFMCHSSFVVANTMPCSSG